MIENQISGICIMNFLAKVKKKNVRPFKVWLGPLLFIKILLKTAQLLSRHFSSGLSLFVSFISFYEKDASRIPQPSVQHLVYVFPIFFRFHKHISTFHLSKNIFVNKFFHWNVFLYNLPPSCKEVASSSLK